MFAYQGAHAVALAALLAGLLVAGRTDGFFEGAFLGLGTRTWVVLAVGSAIVHQAYVWFCWRAQLHHGLLGRVFGPSAFRVYTVGFVVLIVSRPVLVTGLAVANAGTLPLAGIPAAVLSILLAIPAAYTMYSVHRYFGFEQAFGIDHFEEPSRSAPLVKQGAFRFTSNAMYVLGFLALYVPGVAFRSTTALLVALFSHLYIWVHWFTVERPDMQRIYGSHSDRA